MSKMILRKYFFLLFICSVIFSSCGHEILDEAEQIDVELRNQLNLISPSGDFGYFLMPDGSDLSQIPQDPKNELNGPKVALGQLLFHETGIALRPNMDVGMETYSCASCHIAKAGFRPGRFQGIADGGIGFGENGEGRSLSPDYDQLDIDAQGIRPLTVLNVAFVPNTFWNGQFGSFDANVGTESVWDNSENTKVNHLGLSGIEAQNIEGLELHRMHVDEVVVNQLGYRSLFDLSFGDLPESERYSNMTASFAMSAYLRSLLSNRAPFQDWIRGDFDAITEQEKIGGSLFFGKAGCYRCHNNQALGSLTFHAVGVNDLFMRGADVLNTSSEDTRKLGRGGFTGVDADLYKFKVPQLYNLRGTPFYFHGSSKESIREVVEYFNEGIKENPNVPEDRISDYFTPLFLSAQEVDDITAFLDNALRDPFLERYEPESVFSGNCIPNNDQLSQSQIGCP